MRAIYLSVSFRRSIAAFRNDPQLRLYGSATSDTGVGFHISKAIAARQVLRQITKVTQEAPVATWSFTTKELSSSSRAEDATSLDELIAAELGANWTVPDARAVHDPDFAGLPPDAAQRPEGTVCEIGGAVAYSAKLLSMLPGAGPDRRGPVMYRGEPLSGWFTFTPAVEQSVLDPWCVTESRDVRGEPYCGTRGVWVARDGVTMAAPVVVDTLTSGPARRRRYVLVDRALSGDLLKHAGRIALLPVFQHDSETASVVRELDAAISALKAGAL